MSVLPSLLHAILHVDGDSLVLHAGDKPYVVVAGERVELASRGVSFEAVNTIVERLLPAEYMSTLQQAGAVQYALPPQPDLPGEHFLAVAARGAGESWLEIRR